MSDKKHDFLSHICTYMYTIQSLGNSQQNTCEILGLIIYPPQMCSLNCSFAFGVNLQVYCKSSGKTLSSAFTIRTKWLSKRLPHLYWNPWKNPHLPHWNLAGVLERQRKGNYTGGLAAALLSNCLCCSKYGVHAKMPAKFQCEGCDSLKRTNIRWWGTALDALTESILC